FFFFFQAEDGIRDGHVTGVQTCALPISSSFQPTGFAPRDFPVLWTLHPCGVGWLIPTAAAVFRTLLPIIESKLLRYAAAGSDSRSEERRVGKECRSGGAADPFNV